MELVYLWVKKYKNIENEGFNFSPRFECSYDEETKELEVIDKEETKEPYLKDFFGENINITAIVGENGSGKSNLLNQIIGAERVTFENNKLYGNKVFAKNKDIQKYHDDIKYEIVYLSSDLLKIDYINDVWDSYEHNCYDDNIYLKLFEKRSSSQNINIKFFEKNSIKLILKNINLFSKNILSFNPKYYSITFNKIELYSNIITFNKDICNNKKSSDDIDQLSKKINYWIKGSTSIKEKFIATCFARMIFDSYYKYNKEILNDKEKNELIEFNKDLFSIKIEELTGKKLEDIILDYFEIKEDEYKSFLNFFDYLENNNLLRATLTEFNNKIEKYKELFFRLLELDFMQLNFIEEKNNASVDLNFFKLSQGERKLFIELIAIYDKIKEISKSNILLLLDEPDLTLHPTWQKQYISFLLKILNYSDNKIHVIITTHSPFILSDIPKENIIFLEKDVKTGNCINATNKVDINPFGANIHTLLSHGFFMKGGLMGEFAKDKIDEVIKYLNDESSKEVKSNEEAQSIINIIGEPIIKRELQRKLDSKRLSKIDKIDEIEKQMKIMEEQRVLLEYRLESIRKNQ